MVEQEQQHQQPPAAATMTTGTVVTTILEARRLAAQEADAREPYKSKYAAAELLAAAAAAACSAPPADASTAPAPAPAAAPAPDAAPAAARCQLERGLVLLETDLTAQGQAALEEGLACAWPADVESLEIQQQAYNALGSLWCERCEHATALQHLQAAAALYERITSMQRQAAAAGEEEAVASTAARSTSSSWQAPLYDGAQVERSFTTTLFYLAQVHAHTGDKAASAAYCAATLNRQLRAQPGELDLNDWVQNCLQLSGYFLDCNAFALSEYCCAAVAALLLREHAATPPGSGGAVQQPQSDATAQDQRDGKDQAGKQQQEAAVAASKGSPEAASQEQQQQQEQHDDAGCARDDGSQARLVAALSLLEADVAANVCLAFAKRKLYCLVASHEANVEGKRLSFPFASAADVPDVLRFDALPGLPPLASLAWGPAALVHSSGDAALLFKAAMPWFRRALAHYQLDGWVTEHVNMLFEMSNLHRCLAGFEGDAHKRCVLHRHRAKLLAPLEGQLSPTHYPGLSRSISLELGNVFREIADIKAGAGRQPDKVCAAMQAAAGHYKLFVDSFRGDDGALPARVDPDMEAHFLSGMFSMARMLQGLPGTGTLSSSKGGGVATLEQAAGLLDGFVAYVRRNAVEAWQEQADMAAELAGLLQEKVKLVQQVEAL